MAGIYGISSKGRYLEEYQEAFYISGNVTQANLGAALAQDTTAEKTVRLAAANDEIIGRLEVLELRNQEGINVCTVSMKFIDWVPTDGSTIPVGSGVVGGSVAGTVKVAATGAHHMHVQHVDTVGSRVFLTFL